MITTASVPSLTGWSCLAGGDGVPSWWLPHRCGDRDLYGWGADSSCVQVRVMGRGAELLFLLSLTIVPMKSQVAGQNETVVIIHAIAPFIYNKYTRTCCINIPRWNKLGSLKCYARFETCYVSIFHCWAVVFCEHYRVKVLPLRKAVA